MLNFLITLHERNLSYSAINTARSALSTFLENNTGISIGKSRLVVRLMKGLFEMKPTKSRYNFIWDVKIVLDFLEHFYPVCNLDLYELTLKLVMLLALVTAQRAQTLFFMNIQNMFKREESYVFWFDEHCKQATPTNKPSNIIVSPFVNKKLCPVTHLEEYLRRTKNIRGNNFRLFISHQKPHNNVTIGTISSWIKKVLFESGIDTSCFSGHSTRAASTSAAAFNNVPIDLILSTAGWKNAKIFNKFYRKEIKITAPYANAILR